MGSKGPAAPDPYATAAAQTQSNEQTANYNAALNRVSTYTPYGNQVYSQTGTDTSGAPTWRSDVSLAPQAQAQLDNQLKQNDQLSNLGFGLADQAKASLANPVSTNGLPALQGAPGGNFNQAVQGARDAAYGQATSRLDPQWANNQHDLDSKLANQGVVQGSEAWNRAEDEMGRQKTDAYNQADYSAYGAGLAAQQQGFNQGITGANANNSARAQGLSEQTALATMPLNQLNALRSGTQIQNPTFQNAPTAEAAGTDISGDIYKSYQLQSANDNSFMNGLMGLGGAAITKFSDRRLKRDVRRVGTTPVLGLPLYEFAYLWDRLTRHVGVMAQDVLKVRPEAVLRHESGWLAVDYGMIG